MPTNDDINWEKNEPIIRKYGIQTWRNGKRTPEHLVSVTHTGVSLNSMLNEARADQTIKLKSKFRNILHAFANDPDKSFGAGGVD